MNSKKLSINFISGIIQFITSLIISFFFTPYIISAVGEEGYGFYSIACTCISYFTVLATAMNSMASRFITIAYHKGEEEKVKTYYSTVFYSNLFISFLFGIIVILCVVNIDSILNVPTELLSDVKGMFCFVLFSGLLSSLLNVFSSTVFCMNRLDIKSIALIFISIIKVIVLYCLLVYTDAKLIYLGIAYSVSIVLEGLVYIVTTIKMMPFVKLSPKHFNIGAVKTLVGSGIWNSINQVNTILLVGLDLVFANILISPAMSGILSVSKTIPNQVMTLLLILSNIFLPGLTIAYSKKDTVEMKKIFKTSFDILGIVMGILLSGFFVFGEEFFSLWMPETDTKLLYILALLGSINFLVCGTTQTIGNAALLANKLKLPVLITFIRSLVGIALIWILANIANEYAVYFIAGVSPILALIYDLAFTVPYASKCVDIEKRFFYNNKLKFIISIVVLSVMFFAIKLIIKPRSWLWLLVSAVCCGLIGLIFNVFFFLSKEKRKYYWLKIKNKLVR